MMHLAFVNLYELSLKPEKTKIIEFSTTAQHLNDENKASCVYLTS